MVFQKLVSFQVEYAPQYRVTKYISQHSRLQAVHIYSKSSPLVKGYFAVGTECNNDSGVPHTLEHLVFMGSKKYPCKGLLDVAGGIAMSETNAWTATDQTVYTLSSAGWLGFKKLLPVYLDHLIYPTLTEHAYTTEVHHIDPEDMKDKGVVYSEMEGIESTSRFFTALEVQRQMFPHGSGYRSERGGLTKNLRNLTNEEIKQFHSEMYSAENLCVIVCGNVPEEEFLELLEEFDSELPEFKQERRRRPFVDTPASQIPEKLTEMVESSVEFPELDETQGEIVLCWIGKEYANSMDNLAVELLLKYLTETSLSPFSKQLIEVGNPLATEAEYDVDDFMRSLFRIELHGVPTERLEEAKEKTLELLATHTIELDRIRQVIDNSKWHNIYMLEKNESGILAEMTIADFLYGDEEGKTLKQHMSYLHDYDNLLTWDASRWQRLLSEVFLENKPVIVLGKPSVEMYDKIEKEQEDLVESRRSTYSKEDVSQLQKKLADAQYENNKPIPDDVLQNFVIEDPVNAVKFIETKSITTIEHEYNDLKDALTISTFKTRPKDFPLFIHLEHFPSQFVTVQLLLNSRVVKDTTLLPYSYIFRQLFKMPMKDEEDHLVGYEEVVKQLENECMNHDIDLGFTGEFSDFISLEISCKSADYANAVKWIKHCLFDIVFDKTRVHVLLEMFLNSIVERKRDGELMSQSLFNRHMFTDRSIKKSTDVLFVQNRLEKVLEEISNGEFESKVLPKLESLRDQLRSHFHKFHILIMGDMEKLGNIYKPWEPLVNKLPMDKSQVVVPPTPRSLETLSDLGKSPRKKAYIISTPASSSSYMSCATSIPINLDYHHRDFPAITLAAAYLHAVEGPFWKGIRGSGLAYGAYMVKRYEYNCLSFSVYRAVDVINCYQTARYIIQGFAEGTTEFDEHHLHCAVSSVIHDIAIMASDYFGSAVVKYVDDFCKKRGPDFNTKFLARLSKVTIDDLKQVMQKYFVNMFDADKGVVFVSCNPSKLESIQAFLETQGYEVEVEELEDDHEDDCSSCCDSD